VDNIKTRMSDDWMIELVGLLDPVADLPVATLGTEPSAEGVVPAAAGPVAAAGDGRSRVRPPQFVARTEEEQQLEVVRSLRVLEPIGDALAPGAVDARVKADGQLLATPCRPALAAWVQVWPTTAFPQIRRGRLRGSALAGAAESRMSESGGVCLGPPDSRPCQVTPLARGCRGMRMSVSSC
jgi:hypothetical protein